MSLMDEEAMVVFISNFADDKNYHLPNEQEQVAFL